MIGQGRPKARLAANVAHWEVRASGLKLLMLELLAMATLLGCAHSVPFRVVDDLTSDPLADVTVSHQVAIVFLGIPSIPGGYSLGQGVTNHEGQVTLTDHDTDRTMFGLYRGLDRYQITELGYESVEINPILRFFARVKSEDGQFTTLIRSPNTAFTVPLRPTSSSPMFE